MYTYSQTVNLILLIDLMIWKFHDTGITWEQVLKVLYQPAVRWSRNADEVKEMYKFLY